MTRTLSALFALVVAPAAFGSPIFQGTDFVDNRFDAIPPETLLVAAFYDGDGTAELYVQLDCAGDTDWVTLDVPVTGDIETAHYDLNGCDITGRTGVRDVVANGVVDGLGYGLFWKDIDGETHIIRSNADQAGQNVLGVWPLGFMSSEAELNSRASHLTTGYDVLRSLIPGAVLVDDGNYTARNF